MDLFKFLFQPSRIDKGVMTCKLTPGAILLDVRNADEFAEGHIPGAMNVPLPSIEETAGVADFDTPLFVYCRSGNRSREAAYELGRLGFTNIHEIGGINSYSGAVEIG